MTSQTEAAFSLQSVGRIIRENPVLPLIALLAALIILLETLQPGIFNERWVGNTIRFAIPLAMLAACQTLTMLTGGIDLSVGIIATVSAFVVATMTPLIGAPKSQGSSSSPRMIASAGRTVTATRNWTPDGSTCPAAGSRLASLFGVG